MVLYQVALGSTFPTNVTLTPVKVLMSDNLAGQYSSGSVVGDVLPGHSVPMTFFDLSGDPTATWGCLDTIGAPGVDSAGNVFVVSGFVSGYQDLWRFPAPIPAPQAGLAHSADIDVMKPYKYLIPNSPGYHGMDYSVGVAVAEAKGVTQVVESDSLIRFWNLPSSGPAGFQNGQRVDGLIGAVNPAQPFTGAGFGRIKADKVGHLWAIQGQQIIAYNLPLVANEAVALAISPPLPVLGTGQQVDWTVEQNQYPPPGIEDLAVDPGGNFLWVTDVGNNRVFRIRNPLNQPVVDIILGQLNATTYGCNGNPAAVVLGYAQGEVCSQSNPTQSSFAAPGAIALDHHGDLYVSDHALEFAGNSRILRFDAATIQNTSSSTPLFGVPAAAVYGAGGTSNFTSYGCVNPSGGVCGPWEPALNSDDSVMVVGSDAQTSGNSFVIALKDPRFGDNPFAQMKDFDPQAFSDVFDDEDNLYVANHNRSRVMIYLKPFQTDPTATSTPTTTFSPSPTGTLSPSATSTFTPTFSSTPTITWTPTPTVTPTSTWTYLLTATFTPTPECCHVAWTDAPGALAVPDSIGLAYDPSGPGTLYVGGGTTVLGLNPVNGVAINSFASPLFENIFDMARGRDGYLYVIDYFGKVFKVQLPSGTVVKTFSISGEGIRSLCVDTQVTDPDVYVACDSGHMFKVSQSGSVYSVSQLNFSPDATPPHSGGYGILLVDGAGGAPSTLYVSDPSAQRIVQYIQTVPGGINYQYNALETQGGFAYPEFMAMDGFGNIYLGTPGQFLVFDPNFNFLRSCSTNQIPDGRSVAVDPAGNVYNGTFDDSMVVKYGCLVPLNTATPTIPPTPTDTPTITPTALFNTCPVSNTLAVSQPWGVGLDPLGNVYVVDSDTNSVDIYNSAGVLQPQSITLNNPGLPLGVAVDSSSRVFVTDENLCQVDVFTSMGAPITSWGTVGNGPNEFEGPYGIAVTTGSGGTTVFFTDSGNQRVEEYLVNTAPATTVSFLREWGSGGINGLGSFSFPAGVALDSSGNVFVADGNTGLVQVFDGNGNWLRQWDATQGTNLQSANFIASQGCLVYVTDGFGEVGIFDLTGLLLGSLQGTGPGDSFYDTEGIALGNGAWYVADDNTGMGRVVGFQSCPVTGCGTPVPTPSFTPNATQTFTTSPTWTNTFTPSITSTVSLTPTYTPSITQTQTFTTTPTRTPTPTVTPTFTVTSSPTVTPTYSGLVLGPPYPNPVLGKGPICFNAQAPGGATLSWDVFTVAFRKIASGTQNITGMTTVTWDLKGKGGLTVSNGLYYLRARLEGVNPVTKVFKIVILR